MIDTLVVYALWIPRTLTYEGYAPVPHTTATKILDTWVIPSKGIVIDAFYLTGYTLLVGAVVIARAIAAAIIDDTFGATSVDLTGKAHTA